MYFLVIEICNLKIEIRQNSETPGENYSASEEARVAKHFTCIGHIYRYSRPLVSPLETCLNSFQNSIPFLSRRNKTNENVDMPQTFQSAKLILN